MTSSKTLVHTQKDGQFFPLTVKREWQVHLSPLGTFCVCTGIFFDRATSFNRSITGECALFGNEQGIGFPQNVRNQKSKRCFQGE